MKSLKTNFKDALQDMAKSLDTVFKKYSYSSRKSAWERLIKGKGKMAIEKLLIHPTMPVQFKKLSFKEWLDTQIPSENNS